MKAILVMEMPEGCVECPCNDVVIGECWARGREERVRDKEEFDQYTGEPRRCPLVPMPERKIAVQ